MMLPAPHLGFAVVVQAVQAKLVASTKPTTTAEASGMRLRWVRTEDYVAVW